MLPFPEEIVGGGYTISGAAGDELISPRNEGASRRNSPTDVFAGDSFYRWIMLGPCPSPCRNFRVVNS
jgi:hypothetical protein